jgi:hypothetical protein
MAEEKLAPVPTHIRPSVDKDGRKRSGHIAVRHKKVAFNVDSEPLGDSPLDAFISKHGGREHLCKTLDEMTPEQRAKLIDAMAHVGQVTAAAVMETLGIRKPESDEAEIAEHIRSQFLEKLATATEEGLLTSDEATAIELVLNESGPQPAIEALRALADSKIAANIFAADLTATGSIEKPVAATVVEATPTEVEIRRPDEQVTQEDSAAVAAADSATDIGAQARADELFAQHREAANKAVRAHFDIEKREIRGWKVPAQMRETADQFTYQAGRYLADWQQFCTEHGLSAD